jgi:hypothetical protein
MSIAERERYVKKKIKSSTNMEDEAYWRGYLAGMRFANRQYNANVLNYFEQEREKKYNSIEKRDRV